MARFGRILADHGIALTLPADTRHNVTDTTIESTAERVERVLSSLPDTIRQRLEAANQQDVALYDRACDLIDQDHRP